MKHRRILSLITAILLLSNVTLSVLAADWDLEQQGSLHINTNTDYHVTSTDGNGNSVTTSNTISVAPDVTTNITLDNVHIDTGDSHGIDVGSGADVTIDLVGDNSVQNTSDNEKAAIHVSDGDLTITSDSNGTLYVENHHIEGGDSNDGAAIGSDGYEDMSGSITIGGNSNVNAYSAEDGAAIGSGQNGSMSGSITIQDNAKVEASSGDNGAGIGAGQFDYYDYTYDEVTGTYTYYDDEYNELQPSAMSGDITITGNAQVAADSDDDGAGIGSGDLTDMTGSITINGNATVWAESEDKGAGIGSGEDGDISGSITIGGNANVTALSDNNSAGIGGGEDGDIEEEGSITIQDNATVLAIGDTTGSGIGAGGDESDDETTLKDAESMKGTITISDNANVTAIAGSHGVAIGTNNVDSTAGTIKILDNAQVTTGVSADDEAGMSRNSKYGKFIPPTIEYQVDKTRTGIISIGYTEDGESNGMYYISANSVINGIPGWDLESLAKYVEFAADLSNVTIVWDNDNTVCRLIWNDDKDISAFIPDEAAPTKLVESKLSDSKLTEGVAADKILRSCNLKFDKTYSGHTILRFHLGEELAGETVEIRTMKDGKVSAKTVVVTASGIAAITTNTLGDFAVIAK